MPSKTVAVGLVPPANVVRFARQPIAMGSVPVEPETPSPLPLENGVKSVPFKVISKENATELGLPVVTICQLGVIDAGALKNRVGPGPVADTASKALKTYLFDIRYSAFEKVKGRLESRPLLIAIKWCKATSRGPEPPRSW